MFGQAIAIVGRCIEQIDAELEGTARGSNRSLVVELKKEVAQWRGSESEDRSFKSGPAKGATRQSRLRNHDGLLPFSAVSMTRWSRTW
jgi:hypothetical protein